MRLRLAAAAALLVATPSFADDALLDEAVSFTGQIFHLDSGVPGMVIAAVRGGRERGLRLRRNRQGQWPRADGDTQIAIGSISKTFNRPGARLCCRRW